MTPVALVHPEWLNALALATLVCAIALVAARRLASRRCRRLLGEKPPPRARSSDAALFIAGVAVAIALLGPRFGEQVVRVAFTGVDVVFLIDVSRSMDARDIPPSRLDRARRSVEEILVRLRPGDRAALAAFAGRGLLLAPLTPDHDALVDLLAALDTDLIDPASSNLGSGVNAALAAFEAGSDRPRVMVVASDGEDSNRSRDFGVDEARAQRTRVLTIALGSDAGGIVPDGERPLRDRDGEIVHSVRRRDRLAQLADATDGEAFVGDSWGRIDFARAGASVQRDAGAATARGWIEQRVAAIGTAPFSLLAFALLLLEGLPRPRQRRAAAACVSAVAVMLAAGAGGSEPPKRAGRDSRAHASKATDAAAARAREHPGDARAQLELGLAYLDAGRNQAATRAFQASTVFARDAALAAVAYYDLGVAALADGDLDAARDAFFAALDIDPSDEQARFNLEWTLRKATAARPETGPEGVSPLPEGVSQPGAADPNAESESPERARETSDRVSEIPTMSDAQRRHWLERAEDDARPWLRAAAATPEKSDPRSTRPAW